MSSAIPALALVFLASAPVSAAWFVIDQPVEVGASTERVWQVITDLRAYPEWNPFVRACESTLAVQAPIRMDVQLTSWFRKEQTETIIENEPEKRLCYGYAIAFFGALSSRRCHDLQPLGPGRTLYRSSFELSGWLAPVVQLLLGSSLRSGFQGMTLGVQQRAEHLAAG